MGRLIAEAAGRYGVDNMNVLFLTPLPGTRLWEQVSAEGRIALNDFPEDWKYYTLNYPVARYKYLSREPGRPRDERVQQHLLLGPEHPLIDSATTCWPGATHCWDC